MRTVINPDSPCHSNKRNKKFEFVKIFKHQDIGIKQTNKSPHLPCDLKEVTTRGLNFNDLHRKIRKNKK